MRTPLLIIWGLYRSPWREFPNLRPVSGRLIPEAPPLSRIPKFRLRNALEVAPTEGSKHGQVLPPDASLETRATGWILRMLERAWNPSWNPVLRRIYWGQSRPITRGGTVALGFLVTAICASALHAGERSSANYEIVTESIDAGGARSSSSNYTADGSLGAVSGVSTAASPDESVKHGYIGQLYEVTGLQLAATPTAVDEGGGTRQVTAEAALNDGTRLSGSLAGISWSVLADPPISIDADGLATAGIVYEDTVGTVHGSYFGFTDTLDLTVINFDPDNFVPYANDEIDDDWQVLHFGENSPNLAAPAADPDGDEQDNLFEFLALVDPNDPTSFFCTELRPGAAAGEVAVVFSPIFPAMRTYTVLDSPGLQPAAFTPLAGATVADSSNERTVTDPDTSAPRKFYTVEISKP